ncbi:MAG: hypothetical protein MUE44_08175 [Oscillatoriaceae cyanobacterium Prado104]|jgi:hypothetical protein|nr:hypothetical protein [Oscillatoriaceae cyanobacterium Prado104]
MKILKQNQSQLIFRSHPPLAAWTSWILGFFISPIALSLLIIRLGAVGMPTTLSCQRSPERSVSCQLKKHHFPLSWETANIPTGELQKARLDKDSGNGQGTYHHRAVLVTRSGEIPMKEYYSFGEGYQQKIVDRINNFLADPAQKSVSVRYIEEWPEPFVPFAFDIAWLGAGIFCLRSRHIAAKFDRSLNSFTLRQKNAFSNQLYQDSLSEISQIVFTEGELNRKRNYRPYQIFIVMKKGDRLLLARDGNLSNKQKEIIKNIREYLNLQ